jgi:hypothetical protein
MTLLTTIRYRTVLLRLLHHGGTLASCQKAAIEHSKAVLDRMHLTQSQQKLATDAEQKLQAMEV